MERRDKMSLYQLLKDNGYDTTSGPSDDSYFGDIGDGLTVEISFRNLGYLVGCDGETRMKVEGVITKHATIIPDEDNEIYWDFQKENEEEALECIQEIPDAVKVFLGEVREILPEEPEDD